MAKVSAKSLANLAPPWKPGVAPNPAGRPQGARSKLNSLALRHLLEDFETHGPDVIARVRERKPEAYLACVVSLLPRQAQKVDSHFADLSDDELAQLEQLLAAMRAKTVQDLNRVAPKPPPKPKDSLHNGNGSLGLAALLQPGPPKEMQENQREGSDQQKEEDGREANTEPQSVKLPLDLPVVAEPDRFPDLEGFVDPSDLPSWATRG